MRTHISSRQSLPVNLDLIIFWHKTKSIELRIKSVYLWIHKWDDQIWTNRSKTAVIVHYRRKGDTKATSDHYLTGTRARKQHMTIESIDLMRNMPPLVLLMKNQNPERSKGEECSPDAANRRRFTGTAVSLQSACILQLICAFILFSNNSTHNCSLPPAVALQ